ncbi:hypothetical protein GLOTRDRAFT_127638 [Gloeophyllum trabeum ATCC 11539]|uniref:Uncharacterized protein n=1 Tax=Gloeophyllum trabeum (strain ATCC 11539 / FP-39264 / Madison 617) TaxID=670483 RepID=S7QD18_GLOTA|nr:uncharacterized protein GLOTRDRAFT_127638 [Gloeophyllum trabeum ATCC 11539]EPQ57278.1 hypothetical protein GLOTRDRAFT_127638 [Gloeophyllum trabeum ATCC 11539]
MARYHCHTRAALQVRKEQSSKNQNIYPELYGVWIPKTFRLVTLDMSLEAPLKDLAEKEPMERLTTSSSFSANAAHPSPGTGGIYRRVSVAHANASVSARGKGPENDVSAAMSQPELYADERLMSSDLLRGGHLNRAESGLQQRQELSPLAFEDLPLPWKTLLANRSLNIQGPGMNPRPANDMAHLLKASAPAFVPTGSLEGLYHPKLVVEPRSAQPSPPQHYSHRRLPTIDLTQPYLQLPLGRQTLLPTPPSTSSPLWSSDFSPYQESLLSPPELAVAHLPRLSNNLGIQLGNLGMTEQLRRLLYERLGSASSRNIDVSPPLAPPAPIHGSKISRPLSSSVTNAVLQPYISRQPNNHSSTLSSPQATSSPPRLRVPPNTPLQNLSISRRLDTNPFGSHSVDAVSTPPSPQSPETHTKVRTLSGQQPRSIPLAKLIQRRLSAVPEAEEEPSFVHHASRSPSPSRAYSFHRSPGGARDEVPVQIYSTRDQLQRMTSPKPQQMRGRRPAGPPAQRGTSRHTGTKSGDIRVPVAATSGSKAEAKINKTPEGPKTQAPKKRPYRKKNRTSSLDSTATVASVAASSSKG